MRIRSVFRILGLALVLGALAAPTALLAGEPEILYPAKVSTLGGRVFELKNIGHELGDGYFTFYDGSAEGRVAWRDLDKVVFVGNIGYGPGASGQRIARTRRVRLYYLDGTDRVVNLVIGHLHGADDLAERNLNPSDLAMIDFDQARIAPSVYRICERGHQWEDPTYRFCPYDGQPLREIRMDSGR